MTRYNGSLDGMIQALYVSGLKPRQIYQQLKRDFNGNPPLTERTVYNKIYQFTKDAHDKHDTSYRTEAFMAELRLIVESHMALYDKRKKNND